MDRIVTGMRDVSKENYYEAHVTIEPLSGLIDEQLVRALAQPWRFRLATLLMKKRLEDTEERSKNDTFLTARSDSYTDIFNRTNGFAKALSEHGVQVWRFKVEHTIVDTMYQPELLPSLESLPEKYLNPRDPVTN